MSTSLYLQCFGMYIIGALIIFFLVTIPELRALYAKSNEKFSWSRYWQGDWNIIVGTLLVGLVLIIGLDQLVKWKPGVLDYVKWFFAGAGAFLTPIIASKYGTAKKYILKIIDIKANIVSNDIGNTTGMADLKQTAKEQGKDITPPTP